MINSTGLKEKKSPIKQNLIAALIFLILALLLRLEALPLISTHIIGGTNGDIGIYLYISKMLPVVGLSSPTWFDLPVMYPYGKVLAWSDNFILPTIIISFFQKLSLTFVESFNLTMLLFSFLNGFISYIASRKLKCSFFSSLWLGTAMQCSSFLTLHLGHPQLQCLFFIPLGIIALQISNSTFSGILSAATFLGAVLSGIYVAFFTALSILIWTLALKRFATNKDLALFLCGGFVVAIYTIYFLFPYIEVSKAFGGRDASEGYEFAATVKSYISAPSLSALYPFTSSFSHPEAQLFMGIGVSLAILFGLYSSGGIFLLLFFGGMLFLLSHFPLATLILPLGAIFVREREQRAITFIFLLFLSLSFGSIKENITLHSFLSDNLPFIDSLRATGRYGIVALFFGALLGSKSLSKTHWVISVLLLFAAFCEQRLTAFPLEPYLFDQPAQKNLSEVKKGAVVLPFVSELNESGQIKSWQDFAKLQLNHINKFGNSQYVLMNGYSGLQGRVTQPLAKSLFSFPSEVSIQAVRKTLGVNTVIAGSGFKSKDLTFIKEIKENSEYRLNEISFNSDITLIAPPWAETTSLIMRSDNNCTVKFQVNEKITLEKLLNPDLKEIVVELPLVSPQVGARRITLFKNTCNNYWIGDTKVSRGDYIVQ